MTDETTQTNQKVLSLDEAVEESKKAQEAAQANSAFVKIGNHETVKLPFANPPIITKKTVSGTDPKDGRAYSNDMMEFELRAKTPDGKIKSWSIGANNKIVPEILALLKSGVYDIPVHREGEGTSTRYSIAKERAL